MVNKSATAWAKRMRLAVLMRQRLKSVRNLGNIRIPDHIGGAKPTSWWRAADDKSLLIGAATHGVSNWAFGRRCWRRTRRRRRATATTGSPR